MLKERLHILLTIHNPPEDYSTHLQSLQTCILKNTLLQGKKVHSSIPHRRFAFTTRIPFHNKLIYMYVKCESLVDARKVFDHMKERDSISWNTIIAANRRQGYPHEAVTLFHNMQQTDLQPDNFTFASVLPACAEIRGLEQGMDIHQTIKDKEILSDVVVATALVDMYAKCGSIDKAREMFDKMPQRNVVSWNAMIAGYAQNEFIEKALETFRQMKLVGVKPNSTTFASILPLCAKMGALEQGMYIHKSIKDGGLLSDVVVATSLVDMYAKCGSVNKAQELFERMPQRNVFSWTAMIAGYAQNGFAEKALETFKQMQVAGVMPNSTTFASILPACAKMGALEQGMDIHRSTKDRGIISNVVTTALLDMYAKCGSINRAHKLFEKMPQRNVISWNAMIAGYAQNGFCRDALEVFELMKHNGTHPDHVSFVSILLACSYVGLVDEGCKYFSDMSSSYCIIATVDHYVCMIDLLTRAGYLEETLNFIIKMPIKPVVVVWACLLGACRLHMNARLGAFAAVLLFELDPNNAAIYVLLSNIYADIGMWDEAQEVRRFMKARGIKKTPGCSWIEGHKKVHTFFVGDRSHPKTKEIYAKLEKLSCEMKVAGYLPDSTHALNDVELEEKKLFLCHHSEKLAIAFGLLNTPPGTAIRVVKNLRVCIDCHTATKFISKITEREIVVRDMNRFHHFKQGQCSCGDYW